MQKLLTLTIIAFWLFGKANAQGPNPFMSDANGRPLFWASTFVAEGSPYFREEYNWAEITTPSGKVYKDIRVKFNMLDCEVVYMGDNGVEMVATTPIKTLKFPVISSQDGVLSQVVLTSGTNILNAKGNPIYQVLDSGKISHLRKIVVTTRDEKKYGEATTTRHFEKSETDYVLTQSGEYKKLDKSKSFLLGLMADKQAQVEAYINSNNLKCKSSKECQQVIHYYNSL